jgi:glycosyltransferase involved in cell wall biosynthesis
VSAYPPATDGLAHYADGLAGGYAESAGAVTVVGSRTDGADGDVTDARIDLRRDWRKGRLGGLYGILHGLWESAHQYEFVHFNVKPTYFGSGNVHRFLSLFVPLLARIVCRKPTVVTMHDLVEDVDPDAVDERLGPLQRVGATLATAAVLLAGPVTVTSERYRRLLAAKYPFGEVHHVPHGVRGSGEPSPVQVAPFRLLLFGFLSPYKDYETVFAAVDDLRAEREDAELWIVGEAHPDHPEHAERIRDEAVDRPGVRFFGHVEEEMLPTIFERASVLVVPYRTAPGVSGPYQRAKAHGLPAVVYDEEDIRAATIETGGTASLVPPGDPAAMRAAFDRLAEDPDRLAAMAETNAAAADTTMVEVAREVTRIATEGADE